MDEHELPFDVIWLDIEHTNGKRYFTWNHGAFPKPAEMFDDLNEKGRKMVLIVDPHIKVDQGYSVYKEARDAEMRSSDGKIVKSGLFVKNRDGNNFEGNCWPGRSSWIDYLHPDACSYWESRFKYDTFPDLRPNVHIWNDMNEPSVFDSREITMPRDNQHFTADGRVVEHRHLHNLYG